ncbi:RNA-binding protein NOB1-like [Uloborus diversus]|uniref:RNA-binding protein NOB1-like n=1 Tax=Uloborus diversus TaxID=327109 RepID=UPI00240A1590|nr:RNA-binding protein NOB1-like [Uloborus diversus]
MSFDKPKAQCLVVDSGAFIKNAPLHEYGEKNYTVEGAIKEIKDKATRQRLQFLPYKLEVKEPSPDALKYVTEFSKKTGDFASLSATDLQIIALTYQLEKELCGTDHLNKEPTCKITGKPSFVDSQLIGFYTPKQESSDDTDDVSDHEIIDIESQLENIAENSDAKQQNNITDSISEHANNKIQNEENNSTDESEEGWITPSNINEVQKKMSSLIIDQASSVTVACISTDFSVQNVLLQIGLQVLSVDGMLIKQTRVFILRCYACYKTTNIMTKQFCPNCGNKTLKRVAVTINEDGTKNVHINFRKPINLRGTKYSLPTPKGGKHAVNPILCEDQPIPHNRPTKMATQKIDVLSPDYEARSSPFAVNDVYSRAASLGIRSNKSRHHRRNPNEWSKRTGN